MLMDAWLHHSVCGGIQEMKCGVIYYTKTGHSEKIARAVAQELHVQAEDIKTGPVMKELDLLFIVGGIYAGKSDPAMLGYISNIEGSMVKKVALITSCASKRKKQNMVRELLESKQIDVFADEFLCRGSFLFVGSGHPNESDLSYAIAYAKKVAAEVQK